MKKEIRYGLKIQTGKNLDETIKLYEEDIKQRIKAIKPFEAYYPDYPILPEMRASLKHQQRLVKWMKELKKYREEKNNAI